MGHFTMLVNIAPLEWQLIDPFGMTVNMAFSESQSNEGKVNFTLGDESECYCLEW